jgi:protein-S-isoprenylcysteine O-methyltransferase Ste14
LVTNGPYCWIRHPGYLGFIGMAVGLAVGLSSLTGLLGVILLTAGFLFRCQVEERMLIQAFGEQYVTYAKSTGQIIPRIKTIARSLSIRRKIE